MHGLIEQIPNLFNHSIQLYFSGVSLGNTCLNFNRIENETDVVQPRKEDEQVRNTIKDVKITEQSLSSA